MFMTRTSGERGHAEEGQLYFRCSFIAGGDARGPRGDALGPRSSLDLGGGWGQIVGVMSSESEGPKKDGPPPPSIKTPTAPPPPSQAAMGSGSSTPPPSPPASATTPPMNVKVKQGSSENDAEDEWESDEVDESKVPLTTRLIAMGIDLAIGLGLYIAVVIISNFPFLGFVSFLATPVYLAFILMRDGLPFLNGQSPGKSAMKIKAVTTDGQSLAGNWQPALVRNAVLLIPLFGLVELVVLLTREDKPEQGIRLGDEWGKTRVVFANPPEALEEDEASA